MIILQKILKIHIARWLSHLNLGNYGQSYHTSIDNNNTIDDINTIDDNISKIEQFGVCLIMVEYMPPRQCRRMDVYNTALGQKVK